MSETAKTLILKRLMSAGFSESYAVVAHLLALISADATTLQPETELELAEWRGYFRGLRSALHCMVMHEKKIGPESAVLVVYQHVTEALADLGYPDGPDVEW